MSKTPTTTESTALQLNTPADLTKFMIGQKGKSIQNYFMADGLSEEEANKRMRVFATAVSADLDRTPALLECEPMQLIGEYLKMADCGFMPSAISGEAYVLPYKGKAQMQVGYQGLQTLLYKAGMQSLHTDIVRENDEIEYVNGKVRHNIDPFLSMEERGKAIGAYAVAVFNGEQMAKFMNAKDIMDFGKKFSQSFNSQYSPWNEKNDPELWMWKKTVIKQLAKVLPKNSSIHKALSYDNEESTVQLIKKENKPTMPTIDVTTVAPEEVEKGLEALNKATDAKDARAIWKGFSTPLKINDDISEALDAKIASFNE